MDMPAGMHAHILRKIGDPDEVIAFGLFEGSQDELEALRGDPAQEEARVAGMAPYIESIFADGAYEVVEVLSG
jgi:hypothetical protein